MTPTIEQLEKRLQLMQEHVERAHLSGNPLIIAMAENDERRALEDLTAERIRQGEC